MMVPRIDLPPGEGLPDRCVPCLLEKGWRSGIEKGAVAYNPENGERLDIPPFQVLFLPGRESRPRPSPAKNSSGGLRRLHIPCPFDTPEFLEKREVLRIIREERLYHIVLNRFPILPLHYLAIRPPGEPPESLPQCLQGAGEIEDMVWLGRALSCPYHLFFNSNQGADGSRSGSSVNHWHFHIFPTEWTVASRPPSIRDEAEGVEIGEIPDWPARHRLYRSSEPGPLARAVWADVSRLDERDVAYNLEIIPWEDGSTTALLFPRAPTPDLRLPSGDAIRGGFGGYELSGGVVVPSRPIFEWIRAHPEESVALMLARIGAGTAEMG